MCETTKDFDKIDIDSVEYYRLRSLCSEVAKFIDQNFSPHTSIVITPNDFVVKQDVLNGYFKIEM